MRRLEPCPLLYKAVLGARTLRLWRVRKGRATQGLRVERDVYGRILQVGHFQSLRGCRRASLRSPDLIDRGDCFRRPKAQKLDMPHGKGKSVAILIAHPRGGRVERHMLTNPHCSSTKRTKIKEVRTKKLTREGRGKLQRAASPLIPYAIRESPLFLGREESLGEKSLPSEAQ